MWELLTLGETKVSTKNNILILNLEVFYFLKNLDGGSKKEVLFKDIMPTRRRFRADFYLPEKKIIVELNGGSWCGGRHVRGLGYARDLEKSNLAQINGCKYLQYTYTQIRQGFLIQDINIIYGVSNES